MQYQSISPREETKEPYKEHPKKLLASRIPESIYTEPIDKENINPIEAEARYQAERKPGLSVAIRCLDDE